MNRRKFIKVTTASSVVASAGLATNIYPKNKAGINSGRQSVADIHPLAITMWEFSWLERRWPGAGYEDWDLALSELKERGYDAVRIDPFPHCVADDPEKKRKLIPHWDNECWGSPFYTEVQVQPALNHFIQKCKEHGIKVGLSTWWREDTDELAKNIKSGKDLGMVWKKTLDSINEAGLLDNILYVDLSNEYCISVWTPYLPENSSRHTDPARQYMIDSINLLKQSYPDLPYCFSITSEYENWQTEDTSMQELLELHIWIANSSDFNDEVGYHFAAFGNADYKNLQLNSLKVYREKEKYWLGKLQDRIDLGINWSKKSNLPLITTECWGPIDYKDMPLLDWGWVKEACEYGATHAAQSGRWLAVATSNFCGPQFVGMWRDVAWHKRMTDMIHKAPVADDLVKSKLAWRMG